MQAPTMSAITIRPIEESHREWLKNVITENWGTSVTVSKGNTFDMAKQPGFIAELENERIGFATYDVGGDECEIGGLLSTAPGNGAGAALLEAVRGFARTEGCRRVWLVTTNDNIDALRFYQRRGFSLVAVHRGAVNETRRTVKPNIPELGLHGIPLRDEIELEITL